jgi:predicted AAA+ superfamily ATPase
MAAMNKPFRPAQTLAEVARQATLEPLKPGDPRYVDLSAGQETRDLRLLRQYVEDQSADDLRYALAALSGHRGCGKTTQLLRLQVDLAPRFTSIHVYADEQLQQDPELDYPDLMLWLVDELVREFDSEGILSKQSFLPM